MSISERCEGVRQNLGLSIKNFAVKIGLSAMTYSKRLLDPQEFTLKNLEQIAEIGGVSRNFIEFGQDGLNTNPMNPLPSPTRCVPYYGEQAEPIPLPDVLLNTMPDSDQLCCLEMPDDTMGDTIPERALCFLDPTDRQIKNNKIYALAHDDQSETVAPGNILIVRAKDMLDGKFTFSGDAESETRSVRKEDVEDNLKVLGRIVYIISGRAL